MASVKLFGLALLALLSSIEAKEACTLDDFITTVRGRAQHLTPLSLPCFSNYNGKPVARDNAACAAIQMNYSNPWLRANSPNGYMNNQDEMWAL